ncbi:hypothetical protein T02_2488, partial [Trichinella nativa]
MNVPSMPHVLVCPSSLMLLPVTNTTMCLDALCHSFTSSRALVVLNASKLPGPNVQAVLGRTGHPSTLPA